MAGAVVLCPSIRCAASTGCTGLQQGVPPLKKVLRPLGSGLTSGAPISFSQASRPIDVVIGRRPLAVPCKRWLGCQIDHPGLKAYKPAK